MGKKKEWNDEWMEDMGWNVLVHIRVKLVVVVRGEVCVANELLLKTKRANNDENKQPIETKMSKIIYVNLCNNNYKTYYIVYMILRMGSYHRM
jgi:hypothetical protein